MADPADHPVGTTLSELVDAIVKVATPGGALVIMLVFLGAMIAVNLTTARRIRLELLARLASFNEAYAWLDHNTLLKTNLLWRLFSELRHQMNVRGGDPAVSQRHRKKFEELEREMIRVTYEKPILPIVQKRHLRVMEAKPDDERNTPESDDA